MMNYEDDYLSDEQLNMLISEVEEHCMVAAPPDMLESVLDKVDEFKENVNTVDDNRQPEEKQSKIKRPPKVVEYRLYCAKVICGVAAAIMFICVLPTIGVDGLLQIANVDKEQWKYSVETLISEKDVSESMEADATDEDDPASTYRNGNSKHIVTGLRGNNVFGQKSSIGIFKISEE